MRSTASWLAHLRAGGTTPWAQYDAAEAERPADSPPVEVPITGAQQLEVLRRLNELGRVSPTLADRVLHADLTGRGHGLLGLVGVERGRFGTPPVDPADLPYWELMRVVVGLVAEDVVSAGVAPLPPARRPRMRRVRYLLEGDRWLTVPARDDLERRGYPRGGDRAVAFVVGRAMPSMLADLWTWRSLVADVPGWETWLGRLQRSDTLPEDADLAGLARRWADQVGSEQVRVVTDPALLPRILHVGSVAQPPRLSADAIELARSVGPMVGLLAGDARRELMLRGLAPRLARLPGAPLRVPEEVAPWVAEQAARVHRQLSEGHYPVLGDPALVLASPTGSRTSAAGASPSEPAVLTLGLRILLENDPDSRMEGA